MTRHLVLVVGVGRSGTSLLAGVMGELGFHLPQPEVDADETNPRGFGEPQWVVSFHQRLLRARGITVNDSRPAAWELSYNATADAAVRDELRRWLEGEFAHGDAVVVKDPRTVWFLPLWQRCATDLGVQTSYVTMLRHPAEIVRSAMKSYGDWQSEASRTAAWLNVALETERSTRGERRVFVRHTDLLAGWRAQIERVGATLELPLITDGIPDERAAAVDGFVDPSLHRNVVTWADMKVPGRLADEAEQAWGKLIELTATDGDPAALDAGRERFAVLYAEAEAIAQSSLTAAKRRPKAKGKAAIKKPAASLKIRVARRIPKRHRKRLRRLIGR